MPAICFVPGCYSGCTKTKVWNKIYGQKNPSLFRPRTDEIVKKWEIAIKRTDISLTLKHWVCDLHFLESDIERFYSTKLPDGTVFRLKRGIPKLRENAVPTIFPSSNSKYLNKPVKRCNLPVQRDSVMQPKRRKTEAIVMNTEPNEAVLENQPNQFKSQSSLSSPTHRSLIFAKENVNLEEDMANYMKWKMVGVKKQMKKHVVPHIFDCQKGRKGAFTRNVRSAAVKRNRLAIVTESLHADTSVASSTACNEEIDVVWPCLESVPDDYNFKEEPEIEEEEVPIEIKTEPVDENDVTVEDPLAITSPNFLAENECEENSLHATNHYKQEKTGTVKLTKSVFDQLWNRTSFLILPSRAWACHLIPSTTTNTICFAKLDLVNGKPLVQRSIVLDENSVQVFVSDEPVENSSLGPLLITSVVEFESFVHSVDCLREVGDRVVGTGDA